MKKITLLLMAMLFAVKFSHAQWSTGAGNVSLTSGTASIQLTSDVSQLKLLQYNNGAYGYSLGGFSDGGLHFSRIGNGADIFTTAMFDAYGNMGIGTLTPSSRLEIAAPANGAPTGLFHMNGNTAWGHVLTLVTDNATGADDARLLFSYRAGAKNWALGGQNNTSDFGIWEDAGDGIYGSGWGTERFTVAPGGNVGIGTSTPGVKLSVVGSGVLGSFSNYVDQDLQVTISSAGAADKCSLLAPSVATNLAFGINNTETMRINSNGNLLIGRPSQSNPAYKLDVAGPVRANEVVVNTTGADFVFNPTYKLTPLTSLKKYIDKNHHLPQIASAKQMQNEGLSVGENQTRLLQKVEELTLYLIDKDKQLKAQDARLQRMEQKLNTLAKSHK